MPNAVPQPQTANDETIRNAKDVVRKSCNIFRLLNKPFIAFFKAKPYIYTDNNS